MTRRDLTPPQTVGPFFHGGLLPQAPHLNVFVFARGLLDHLRTRLYFDDERTNTDDPVLRVVPQPRRPTLLAKHQTAGGRVIYRYDVVLQGDGETVFFTL